MTLPQHFRLGVADLVVIVAMASLFLQFSSFANDPGLGWHMRSGEIFWHSGPLYYDPFLAGPPRLWVPDQWLGSTIIWWLYAKGGFPLLYALFGVLQFATFMIILHSAAVLSSGSVFASSIAALLSLKLSSVHFILRPVVPAFFLMALLLYLIYRDYQLRINGKSNRWFLYSTPPLFALWANIHPYFVLGLGIFGLYLFSLVCDFAILKRYKRSSLNWVPLFSAFLFSIVATLLTPYGFNLHRNIFSLGGSSFYTDFLLEWRQPSFKSPEGQWLEIMVLILMSAIILRGRAALGWGFFEFFSLAAFLHFTLGSSRGMPLFAMVAVMPMAQAIRELAKLEWFKRFPEMRSCQALIKKLDLRETTGAKGYTTGLVICLVLAIISWMAGKVPFYSGIYGPDLNKIPTLIVKKLATSASAERPSVIANYLDFGGIIIWQGWPALRPIVDDRLTLHQPKFYQEYIENFRIGGNWQKYINEKNADYLLLKANSDFAKYIKDTKALPIFFEDEVAIAFKAR